MFRLFLIFFVFMLGCSSTAVQYARAKYPHCSVEEIGEETVLVSCPNKKPFEKRFRQR